MFSHMEKLPISYFDTHSHGELMSTFTNDVDMLNQSLKQSVSQVTSSVDTRTEKLISEGMDKLMEGRTTFVIAHRLSTVRDSNAIMVLEHGKIIERGDHDGLMKEKGRYYALNTGAVELE